MSEVERDHGYTRLAPHRTDGLLTIRTDLGSFPSSGRGPMRVPAGVNLVSGQRFAVTDDEADTLAAQVLDDPRDGLVEIRIDWSEVLAYA